MNNNEKNELEQPVSGNAPEKCQDASPAEVVGVRFKDSGKIYYFAPGELELSVGENVIVETVRGLEFGTVAAGNKTVKASEIIGELKPVVRKATDADIRKNIQNKKLEESARSVWAENVQKNGLVMQLVDVEYTFDNSKLIFYFTADGRCGFSS